MSGAEAGLDCTMKAFILFALFAACKAAVLTPALLSTGASNQYRSQDNFGNYAFGYDEGHLSGGSFRKETGDAHGNKYGSYGLRDADGRYRIVNYVADATGFHADIKSNEPGVEPKDSANAAVNKPTAVIAAPAVHYAAAVPAVHHVAPVAVAAAAPVVYHAPRPLFYHHTIAHAVPLTGHYYPL